MLPANIDTLKSTINSRGGVARSNRFAIYMSSPVGQNIFNSTSGVLGNAARSLLSGGSISPRSLINDPRDIYLLAESCSIPGKSILTTERKIGSKAFKVAYGISTEDVSFTFNLTNDYYMFKYFNDWINMIVPNNDSTDNMSHVNYKSTYTTDVTIQQMGSTDFIPVYSVKLLNAYPLSINSVDLSNASEDISKVTISMAYDNWREEGIVDGILGAIGTTINNII